MKTCSVEGCERSADVRGTARGWCYKHYTRWRKHGDPLAVGRSGHGGLRGSRNPAARLTAEQVLEMRRLSARGWSARQCAEAVGWEGSRWAVRSAISGANWGWLR